MRETKGLSPVHAASLRLRNPSIASAAENNLGPTGVQALREAENEEPGSLEIPEESRALTVGAEHRVRTGDLRLGKATLYQLS